MDLGRQPAAFSIPNRLSARQNCLRRGGQNGVFSHDRPWRRIPRQAGAVTFAGCNYVVSTNRENYRVKKRRFRRAAILPIIVLFATAFAPLHFAVAAEFASSSEAVANAVVTHHQIKLEGRTIAYRAVVGETVPEDARGNPAATIFSTSYLVDGATDARRRYAYCACWTKLRISSPNLRALSSTV